MTRLLAFPDWCYSKLPSRSWFWAALWLVWFSVLWMLSSSDPKIDQGPEIPHFDKVLHFGYFMIGGFAIANFLHLSRTWNWKKIVFLALLTGAAVGALDEYHQSFNEARFGNDVWDWTADCLGTLAGAIYCMCMWKRLKPAS